MISTAILSRLNEIVCTNFGLDFAPNRLRDLDRGLAKAARDCGFEDKTALASQLLEPDGDIHMKSLVRHLTIGETYFFREPNGFQFLETRVIPELLQRSASRGRRMSIWSAGCCTGEETYSLAISLLRNIPDACSWNLSVVGTDINPDFLRHAVAGRYGDWSFRGVPAATRSAYFKRLPTGQHEVNDCLRKLVAFKQVNLARETEPMFARAEKAMDVIFCRNVLLYFRHSSAERAISTLVRCLAPGGWLFLGAAEATHKIPDELQRFAGCETVAYRRRTAQPANASRTQTRPAPPLRLQPAGTAPSAPAAKTRTMPAAPEASTALQTNLSGEAEIHANRGSLEQGLNFAEKAISNDPDNPRLHYLRAAILQEMDRSADACACLRNVLYLAPDFVMAHVALGSIAQRRQAIGAARRHFCNALELLGDRDRDEEVPSSEGLTVARLAETIRALLTSEVLR